MRKSPIALTLFWLLFAAIIYIRFRIYHVNLLMDDFSIRDGEGGHPNPYFFRLLVYLFFIVVALVFLAISWRFVPFAHATSTSLVGVLVLVLALPLIVPASALRSLNDTTKILRYEEHPYVQSPLDKPIGLEVSFDLTNGTGGLLGGVSKAKLHIYMTEPDGRVFKMSCIPWAKGATFNHAMGNKPLAQPTDSASRDWLYGFQVSVINDGGPDTIIDSDDEPFQTHVHALCIPIGVVVTNRDTNRVCVNNEESGAVTQKNLYSHPEKLNEGGGSITYLKGSDAERKSSGDYLAFLAHNKRESGVAKAFLYTSLAPYGFGEGPDLMPQLLASLGPDSKLASYSFWHDAIQQIQPDSLKEKGYSYCLDNFQNCKEPRGCNTAFDELKCFCH